ncbi:hypothetical protein AVEN_123321-1 [Araneus ventricosus]|uniref:Uncharacterized protein n=1 Tax=Araneus ventricosus TaxID=182803 RepID=A0A4Y2KQD3_ARAVE|nr:hypothetical protein AVEN_123321-1 [Araneus ventricosus]
MDTLIPARRKGVGDFSVETAGSVKHPHYPHRYSDSEKAVNHCAKLLPQQAFRGLCNAVHSIDVQTISRVGDGEVDDVCASRLITLTRLEYGAPCETLLVHLFHPVINLACCPSARRGWITALCADLGNPFARTAETTLRNEGY